MQYTHGDISLGMRKRPPKPDWDYPAPKHPGPGKICPQDSRLDLRLPWHTLWAFRNAAYRNGLSMAEATRQLMQAYIDAFADKR